MIPAVKIKIVKHFLSFFWIFGWKSSNFCGAFFLSRKFTMGSYTLYIFFLAKKKKIITEI
jgi:hypothetical protein